MVATPREIELAAKYIVDRFGTKVEIEEDAEPGGDVDDEQGRPRYPDGAGGDGGYPPIGGGGAHMGDQERDQLASALERLADVQVGWVGGTVLPEGPEPARGCAQLAHGDHTSFPLYDCPPRRSCPLNYESSPF